jgi:predicted kinase
MQKNKLSKQLLIMLYGLPGSGKSFFSRQTSELLGMPIISSDRIRYELFEKPSYSKEEQQIVFNLMTMMLEEYAKVGMSAIFDVSMNRAQDRKSLREFTKKQGMTSMLVWIQADSETCYARAKHRDGRKADDKFSADMSRDLFDAIEKQMQPPQNEDAIVISGKHLYDSQRNVFLRKLRELQVLSSDDSQANGMPMPGLVNLVSNAQMNAGRVDQHRRNVSIS